MVDRIKGEIIKAKYDEAKELKLLRLEQKKLEKNIKENQLKAEKETDLAKRALLLKLIGEDSDKLKENIAKQKEKFVIGEDFDPDKYIKEIIDGVKNKLAGKKKKDKKNDV